MSTPIPRLSLPGRTTNALREDLAAARWQDCLPSEAELCREFQVSRGTLRQALARLTEENRIAPGGRGRRHRILHAPRPAPPSRGRVIRILTPEGTPTFGELHLIICDSLRDQAGRAGYRVEFERQARLYRSRRPGDLARLATLPDTAGWVVLNSTEAIQRWFSAAGLPCVVMGPPWPGVNLGCVWPDTRASARHAAGLFHARGHTHVAYLRVENTSLGDSRGAAAFVEEAARLGLHARVVVHPHDGDAICRAVDAQMAMRPRPTGFLSYSGYACLTILSHLQNTGWRVPQDASVVAGWAEGFLDDTRPTIAHYRIDGLATGRKIARMLIRQIERDAGTRQELVIVPEFVPGGSLGPPGPPSRERAAPASPRASET